ncbi:MAG: tRNA epoxyqueuosine(34) reductase QueG [Armatimonadota bacterium]|nr:tRNA epoxyqueuosine(34) reductase QueG [bacterium]
MIEMLNKWALESGLAKVGVAPVLDEVRKAYPWAKSVIVTAICYLPPEHMCNDEVPQGLVARVARGKDYHDVLREKIGRLAARFKEERPGARVEVCVDTCPLPERKLAVLGGIAWRGRNGNVFVEGCGSYAALGELVTDIELPTSKPLDIDRCTDCGRCVRYCPTHAIGANGSIDTSRCLSALTQMSGIIPRELRKVMGNRIYGCDVCQEVCPQNAGVKPSVAEFAEEMLPGACPELIPLIDLSAEEFKNRVKSSSIGWIRRTRIRRNAAIAAGNLKCEQAIASLARVLRDESSILRAHAAWALGEIGSEIALTTLENALTEERDATVIEEIRAAMSK